MNGPRLAASFGQVSKTCSVHSRLPAIKILHGLILLIVRRWRLVHASLSFVSTRHPMLRAGLCPRLLYFFCYLVLSHCIFCLCFASAPTMHSYQVLEVYLPKYLGVVRYANARRPIPTWQRFSAQVMSLFYCMKHEEPHLFCVNDFFFCLDQQGAATR